MDSIGSRITQARNRMGINQKELCKLSGLKESTLSRYEKNEREPKASNLFSLAEVLDVSFDFLMGVNDNMGSFKKIPSHLKEKEVTKILENTNESLSQEGLLYYGEPIAKEDINRLLTAIKVGAAVIDIKK